MGLGRPPEEVTVAGRSCSGLGTHRGNFLLHRLKSQFKKRFPRRSEFWAGNNDGPNNWSGLVGQTLTSQEVLHGGVSHLRVSSAVVGSSDVPRISNLGTPHHNLVLLNLN